MAARVPITVELNLGGTWTAISSKVYARDRITITRGKSSEGASIEQGRCALTLNNRDGRFTPKNPTGPYYGLIGRNTQIRVSVDAGSAFLATTGTAFANTGISTPDATALDITGDIDIRLDAALDNWWAPSSVELAGKFRQTGNQRSWALYASLGTLRLEWSANGSSPTLSVTSTASMPLPPSKRMAVRATLDVDNGASGNTVTFYTAPTISGPWTQLGAPVVTAGTTSLFNSTAELRVGDACGDLGFASSSGRIYSFELRNGIGGTVVANPVFTSQTPGATTFTDGAGRTWTLGGSTTISNRRVRFVGAVSEWPTQWTTGGGDAWVQATANGVLRRLNQGVSPLQSPMRREFSNPARQNIRAYWPCEDGSAALSIASAISNAPAMTISNPGVTPAADSTWVASDALPTMGAGTLRGAVPTYTITGQTALRLAVKPPSGGVAVSTRLVSLRCTGTATTWSVWINSTAQLALRAYDVTGTQILDTGFGTAFNNGDLITLGVELTETGSDVAWKLVAYRISDISYNGVIVGVGGTGTLTGRTVGRVTTVVVGEDGGLGGTVVGHIAVADSTSAYAGTANALIGQAGESVMGRVTRLAAEEQLSLTTYGTGADPVGPQRLASLLSLLGSAADVNGTLYEQRDAVGLALRCREADYNQVPAMTLNYTTDLAPPLEPIDDDTNLRNDVTVSRDQGASARAVLDTGTLSVQDPPNGVGRYDSSVSLNLFTDDQAAQQAAWRLHFGTVDEPRYPTVSLDLAARPWLIDAATAADVGDRFTVSNPPAWLPPGLIDEQILGYTETLDQSTWTIRYNCAPASPWNVATADDAVYGRADTDGSQLAAAVSTTTATSLSVATTTSGPLWTTSAGDFPFDITVGGEVMTVTNITGSSSPQTFTVTRSVNGVQKTHTSGEDVRLAYPSAAAL